MTLAGMRALVSQYLGQPISDGMKLTTAIVNQACNDGYVQFAMDVPCYVRVVTLALLPGTATYALPADVIAVSRILSAHGHELKRVSLETASGRELQGDESFNYLGEHHAVRYMFNPVSGIQIVGNINTAITVTVFAQYVPSSVSGGVPLLVLDTDTPVLPAAFQNVPALWAVGNLAQSYFSDDDVVLKQAEAAVAFYQRQKGKFFDSLYQNIAY